MTAELSHDNTGFEVSLRQAHEAHKPEHDEMIIHLFEQVRSKCHRCHMMCEATGLQCIYRFYFCFFSSLRLLHFLLYNITQRTASCLQGFSRQELKEEVNIRE